MTNRTANHIEDRLRRWDILSAVDPKAAFRWSPAPRLSSLHGRAGGFLGNRKGNAQLLLLSIKESLDRQYELGDGTVVDKFIYSRPASPEILDALAERCDFVVTAIAD